MSSQQDIYAAGSKNRPLMLNKDNYVPWSSRIIRYARSRPKGKMIVDSIENGPYVRRMIAKPGEPDLPVSVPESFHEQSNGELIKNDIKRMDADDQAIQTILLGLLGDVDAAVVSCETAKEIQELCQTKNLHEADITQIYDFLKMNQDERTKKIMETMNVTFNELSAMAFKQSNSKPGLQSLTSGQISSGLELTYAPSTITPQIPSERAMAFEQRSLKPGLQSMNSGQISSELDLTYAPSTIMKQQPTEDLKDQLQDKSIAISELKKLIAKLKGKYVDTKFEKSSVIRQPNAFKSQRPSVLGKPTTLSNSFIRKDFSKSTSVTKNNVSNGFSKPVTAQTLPTQKKSCLKNTNVLASGMYKIHTDHTQARTSKLPQDSKKTNKRVSFSTGVTPTTSVSIPQLKSNLQGDRVLRSNSHGKKLEVEEPRKNVKLPKNKMSVTACNDSLNAKTVNVTSVSAMCAKCMLIEKHDLCVPKSVAKPLTKTVTSKSIKKPRNNIRKLHECFGKTYKWAYIKFTPSGYIWKPKSKQENVNSNVSKPLGNASRTVNVKETMTSRRSIVSNTPLSSNSFTAHRDCSIHRRL
nr:hypothetical protein [Tanacetum cinerariifolium]